MSGLRTNLTLVVAISLTGMLSGKEANAQSASAARASSANAMATSSSTSSLNSTTASSSAYGPAVLPFPFPMYAGNASGLSPTDAAALGTTGNQTGNMFNNPMAAPFLYSSMFPSGATGTTGVTGTTGATGMMNGGGLGGMATNQLGLMMLANQAQGGIGSGQLSGVRPGPKNPSRSKNGKAEDPKARRRVSPPAGLAANYFNRTTIANPRRPIYYDRPSSQYPQAGH